DACGDEDGEIFAEVAAFALARDVDRPDFLRRLALGDGGGVTRREAEIFFVDRDGDLVFAEAGELGRRRILHGDRLINGIATAVDADLHAFLPDLAGDGDVDRLGHRLEFALRRADAVVEIDDKVGLGVARRLVKAFAGERGLHIAGCFLVAQRVV